MRFPSFKKKSSKKKTDKTASSSINIRKISDVVRSLHSVDRDQALSVLKAAPQTFRHYFIKGEDAFNVDMSSGYKRQATADFHYKQKLRKSGGKKCYDIPFIGPACSKFDLRHNQKASKKFQHDSDILINNIRETIAGGESQGYVLHDGTHATPIIIHDGNILLPLNSFADQSLMEAYPGLFRNNEFSNKIFQIPVDCASIEIDEYDHSGERKRRTYQADNDSCAWAAAKIIKTALENDGELLDKSIVQEHSEGNRTFMPSPLMFKHAQSDQFLSKYIQKFSEVEAYLSGKGRIFSREAEQELNEYRTNNKGRYALIYSQLKNAIIVPDTEEDPDNFKSDLRATVAKKIYEGLNA